MISIVSPSISVVMSLGMITIVRISTLVVARVTVMALTLSMATVVITVLIIVIVVVVVIVVITMIVVMVMTTTSISSTIVLRKCFLVLFALWCFQSFIHFVFIEISALSYFTANKNPIQMGNFPKLRIH